MALQLEAGDGWVVDSQPALQDAAAVGIDELRVEGGAACVPDVTSRLERFGACVVERLLDEEQVDALAVQLEAAATATIPSPFTGKGGDGLASHPVTRLGPTSVFRAPLLSTLCEHDLVYGAAESLLTRHCKSIALKLVAPIWLTRQNRQLLHHEDGLWPGGHALGHEWCVDVIWALDNFDEDNGSTIVVPQSNHWPRSSFTNRSTDVPGMRADSRSQLKVTMPKGSALLFTGSTLHAGGENRTEQPRRSVLIGYQLGWLRPEHKFYAVREAYSQLDRFSTRMQALMGFDNVADASDPTPYICASGNYAYLSRTPEQVASQTDKSKHTGACIDEPYYHGPLVIPNKLQPQHGRYLAKLCQLGRL